jgi:GDP-L-fucose synthase
MNDMNVFVAGHNGMVGSAIVRKLKNNDDINLIICSRSELDLMNERAVLDFFMTSKIDQVYLSAAKVGGIFANSYYPADFIYENLTIQNNIINSAHTANVQDLLFLGSSCIYPKYAEQPIKESSLLCGSLEETNESYAVAKIAGIKMCEAYNRQYGRNYRSVMPTNLYGENDNFHSENAHVIPALIRRFHEAKIVEQPEVFVWGTGTPLREFLYVDDMASASIHILNLDENVFKKNTKPTLSHINIGTGLDCSINELVVTIAQVVGYKGKISFDINKPDGTPRKLLDVTLINKLGWQASVSLKDGLAKTYSWFIANQSTFRK